MQRKPLLQQLACMRRSYVAATANFLAAMLVVSSPQHGATTLPLLRTTRPHFGQPAAEGHCWCTFRLFCPRQEALPDSRTVSRIETCNLTVITQREASARTDVTHSACSNLKARPYQRCCLWKQARRCGENFGSWKRSFQAKATLSKVHGLNVAEVLEEW